MIQGKLPIANPVVVLREEFDDWAVLFNPDTAEALGINPVGVAVWKLLDGHRTLDEIVALLGEQFEGVGPGAAEDLSAYMAELAASGLVGYEVEAVES